MGPRAVRAHVREGRGPRVRGTHDAAPALQDGLLFQRFQTTGRCLHVGSTSSRVPPSGRAPTGGAADFSGDPLELISASGAVTLTPATLTELLQSTATAGASPSSEAGGPCTQLFPARREEASTPCALFSSSLFTVRARSRLAKRPSSTT